MRVQYVSQKDIYSKDPLFTASNDAVRAISKIPTEIWWIIFAEATRSQDFLPLQEHMSESYNPPDFTSLYITAVCREWRLVAMGTTQIWRDILITWRESWEADIQRIKHYLFLSGSSSIRLIVTEKGSDSLPTAEYLDSLEDTLNGIVRMSRVICLLNTGSNDWMSYILRRLPPISDMWILNNSICNGNSHGSIPPKHNESLKRLLIDTGTIGWDGNVELEEFTLNYSHHCNTSPAMSYAMAYTMESTTSLKILAVHGGEESLGPHVYTKDSIHTLKMSLNFLARHFLPHCKVPNLSTIEVTTASIVEEHEWEALKSCISLDSVKELVCHSMSDHLDALVEYISDFGALSKLEIRGGSVDTMLISMTDRHINGHYVFPHLERLIISSYTGSGRLLIPFVQARHLAQQLYLRSNRQFVDIILEECTGMSIETRLDLQEVLGSCNEMHS